MGAFEGTVGVARSNRATARARGGEVQLVIEKETDILLALYCTTS